MQETRQDWHLDKKFSIGIIIAIVGQCCSFLWYGAKLDSRVEETTAQVVELRAWKDRLDDDRSKIDAHLAVVDEKLSEQGTILHRIDDHIEQMTHGHK